MKPWKITLRIFDEQRDTATTSFFLPRAMAADDVIAFAAEYARQLSLNVLEGAIEYIQITGNLPITLAEQDQHFPPPDPGSSVAQQMRIILNGVQRVTITIPTFDETETQLINDRRTLRINGNAGDLRQRINGDEFANYVDKRGEPLAAAPARIADTELRHKK